MTNEEIDNLARIFYWKRNPNVTIAPCSRPPMVVGYVGGFRKAASMMYSEEQLCDLVQSLKDYTNESKSILGHDDREPKEFVDIFLQSLKQK